MLLAFRALTRPNLTRPAPPGDGGYRGEHLDAPPDVQAVAGASENGRVRRILAISSLSNDSRSSRARARACSFSMLSGGICRARLAQSSPMRLISAAMGSAV